MNKEEKLKELKNWKDYYFNLIKKHINNEVLKKKYYARAIEYMRKITEFIDTDGRGYFKNQFVIDTSSLKKSIPMDAVNKTEILRKMKKDQKVLEEKRKSPKPFGIDPEGTITELDIENSKTKRKVSKEELERFLDENK